MNARSRPSALATRRTRRFSCLVLSAVSCSGAASLACAQASDGDAIALELPDCAGVSGADVGALVALEVAPRPLLAEGSELPATTRGRLECLPEGARISVEDAERTVPLRVEVKLTDLAPAARPRLLALAMAELIATSRLEQPDRQRKLPAPAALRQSSTLWLGAGLSRAAEPAIRTFAVAAGAIQAWDWFALAIDLRFDHGQRTAPSAELSMNSGSLALAAAWRSGTDSPRLVLGPGLRVGYAQLRGTPRSSDFAGRSLSGLWLGPCVLGTLQLDLSRGFGLSLGIELGYASHALRGVDAKGDPLLELGGPWLSAQLGIHWIAREI